MQQQASAAKSNLGEQQNEPNSQAAMTLEKMKKDAAIAGDQLK